MGASDDPPMPASGFVPLGHFYSPIPDWPQIVRDQDRIFKVPDALPGIDFREPAQLALLDELARFHADLPFPDRPDGQHRYHYDNPAYGPCDAILLYALLRHLQPRRLVEVGSGHSSCVTLDTNELFLGSRLQMTCIEPYPELLHALMRPGDRDRVQVLAQPVQTVDLQVFSELQAGDILFIDSTHVCRVDSDVNRLLFEVLPSLPVGVYIHFHDVFYPFQYPRVWVLEGRAWNELYLLRAFLQYNAAFEIVLMSTYLAHFHGQTLQARLPRTRGDCGGSRWLRKIR